MRGVVMITISWYFLIFIVIITGLWIFVFIIDSSSGKENKYRNNRRKNEESVRQRGIHHKFR